MVERGGCGSTSMSQDDIEKLPCFDFTAREKGSSPPADCAVCLDKFSAGERCRLLPSCNHTFHADCVDLWLLRTPLCPICRAAADHTLTRIQIDGHQVLDLSRVQVQGREAVSPGERERQQE